MRANLRTALPVTSMEKLSARPFWLVGFRPFFTLACLSGMVLPLLWVLVLGGHIAPPVQPFSPLQWHAHEMLFGFGWAVMAGFLLTATKNWVGIRGYHGGVLMLLVALWLLERIAMWFAGALPPIVFRAGNNAFLATIVALLLYTLLRHRASDSYRTSNWAFVLILPAFIVAKQLVLSDTHFAAGVSIAIGLYRVAFIVMLERTLTQFMKNVFGVSLLRNVVLDRAILLLALFFVGEVFYPRSVAGSVALALATLLLARLVLWRPDLAMRRLDIGIMFLGYGAIVAQLAIEAAATFAPPDWVGSVSVHVFGFGAMGLIIPAMFTRICNGHTGRKVVFGLLDKTVLWIMMSAFVVRVGATQLDPAHYLAWIDAAAACWFVAFGALAWRYVPYLLAARLDGREH